VVEIVGDFIVAHSAPVALRDGILYVRVLEPVLHYQLKQVSKVDILRKLKNASSQRSFATCSSELGKQWNGQESL